MLNQHSKQISKYVLLIIFNLTLFPSLLCFSKPAIANSNSKISELIQERDKSLQEVYRLNSLKIQEALNQIKLWMILQKQGQSPEKYCRAFFENKQSTTYLVDLHRETFNIGLKLVKSQVDKIEFLATQLKIADSVEESQIFMNSMWCNTRYSELLASDFRIKIRIMLLEENQ